MNKLTLVIDHDTYAENPREFGDTLGTFVGRNHNRYTIGDKQAEPFEAMVEALYEIGAISDKRYETYSEMMPAYFDDNSKYDIQALFDKHFIWRWVYIYDHSGVAFRTYPFNCQWDSGVAGIIYVSKKQARKDMGYDRLTDERIEKVKSFLVGEIKDYSHWANGEVYIGTIFEHEDGQDYSEGEILDSCGGFFGHDFETNGIMEHGYNVDEVIVL